MEQKWAIGVAKSQFRTMGNREVGPHRVITGVAVEKPKISEIQSKFGDRKCLGKPNKSFVGHPDAIYFLRIFVKRVFRQPQGNALIGKLTPLAVQL